MSTIAQLLQAGQPDLELAAVTTRVLLAPISGTTPLTTLEDSSTGGLDLTKVGRGTSPFVTVGNYEKKAGVKLSNKPTLNKIMSAGYGSPTRNLFSEAGKGITYVPQEVNMLNLQNAWGFTPSALSSPSSQGGITIGIPELPARMLWRVVLLTADVSSAGNPIYLYWIANRAEVGERQDIQATDSDVLTHGVSLDFQVDAAVGLSVIFGICGQGWVDLNHDNTTGLYPAVSSLTISPLTLTVTAATGVNHAKPLTVKDNNTEDRTTQAVWTSSDPTKATVGASTGIVTGIAVGTTNVSCTYAGVTSTAPCVVTVS